MSATWRYQRGRCVTKMARPRRCRRYTRAAVRQFPFRAPTREFLWREGGQSVVLVALMFAVLMGFTAMSIDIGRFYAERRFVQNAVDSAALACAVKYATSGQDAAQAWAAGDAVLQQRNLLHNPLGLALDYAERGEEQYDGGIVQPVNLNSGILPTSNQGLGCRVAISVRVPTYLIKVVSPSLNTIGLTTRAYAKAKGGLLPSVVKRYLNVGDTDNDPTNDGANEFVDTTAASGYDSACHAYSNYLPSCVPASLTQPGREIVLFGASQTADNDSSFRGYIGLDIRDFSDAIPPDSANLVHAPYNYNGVAPDVTVNTLKDFEANWITQGYPGPDICTVDTTQFLKCAQIAAINGSSSGIFVDYYNQFFSPGDIGLFQLYDGTTKSVPDFTFAPPTLAVPTNGSVPSKVVAYSMSSQFAITASQICTQVIFDDGTITGAADTTGMNPFNTGALSLTSTGGTCTGTGHGNFASNPTPANATSYNQTWSGMTATNAHQGIYQVFLRGSASAPYASRVHDLPVKVNVNNQVVEYDLAGSTTQQSVSLASLPATVAYTQQVGTNSGPRRWQPSGGSADGIITVSWDSCPVSIVDSTSLSCYIGSPGTRTATVVAGNNIDVTVSTSGATSPNTYYGWLRFTGTDHTGNPVVKLEQLRLDVDQATGGTTEYIDVIGYAAYQITHMDSNDVYGRAVSQAYLDPNDSALSLGKKITLVPWETP